MNIDLDQEPRAWRNEPGAPANASEVLGRGRRTVAPSGESWAQQAIYGFDSHDRRSRPFNLLRSQIVKIMQANGWRTLGITSATPQVGKSFVSVNLAASLSRVPTLHTLLFDFDLRRGSIARTFGIERGSGIEAFLAGSIPSLADAAYEVEDGRLTIFPGFSSDASSAELLAGKRMGVLAEAIHQLPAGTLCICDLPPAFANDDAAIALRTIDAYLFVVEEGRTTARQIRDAMSLLSPTPCVGTVLNRYDGGVIGDDYGFGYRSGSVYDNYYS